MTMRALLLSATSLALCACGPADMDAPRGPRASATSEDAGPEHTEADDGGAPTPDAGNVGDDAGPDPDDAGPAADPDAGPEEEPDAGEDTATACPWGAAVPADPAVGLAALPHDPDGTELEQRVFDRMNAHRDGAPLAFDACLGDLARSHSHDMVARGYYGHGTAGNTQAFLVGARADSAGYVATGSLDEDVLQGDLVYWLGGQIENAVDLWMTDGHAIPILGCERAGVGLAEMPYLDTTLVFVTANFDCW